MLGPTVEPTSPTILAERLLSQHRPKDFSAGYWKLIADNAERWACEFGAGPFWGAANQNLGAWRQEFRQKFGGSLLASDGLPPLVGKSDRSIADKVGRKLGKNGEELDKIFPVDRPFVPQISDLVRTRVQCKFIDGVEFLATKLADLASDMGCLKARDRQGKVEGYFAQHVTVEQDAFYRIGGAAVACKVTFEIQVASDLATKMWEATHLLYEVDRGDTEAPQPKDWQWDASNPRFISNQLGHMMHLADGLLVQLRNTNSGEKK
ncbi:hypothetical protein [Ralstonia sp.]|uniref:hypothetical protein n=1 Tax=Ralstonia sp. TaxID=54061 RepID=UPI0031DAA554